MSKIKDEPVYLDDNEDGISLVAFTDYDNRKKVIVSLYFKCNKMRTVSAITTEYIKLKKCIKEILNIKDCPLGGNHRRQS